MITETVYLAKIQTVACALQILIFVRSVKTTSVLTDRISV